MADKQRNLPDCGQQGTFRARASKRAEDQLEVECYPSDFMGYLPWSEIELNTIDNIAMLA